MLLLRLSVFLSLAGCMFSYVSITQDFRDGRMYERPVSSPRQVQDRRKTGLVPFTDLPVRIIQGERPSTSPLRQPNRPSQDMLAGAQRQICRRVTPKHPLPALPVGLCNLPEIFTSSLGIMHVLLQRELPISNDVRCGRYTRRSRISGPGGPARRADRQRWQRAPLRHPTSSTPAELLANGDPNQASMRSKA